MQGEKGREPHHNLQEPGFERERTKGEGRGQEEFGTESARS